MYLKRLRLENYRNITSAEIIPDRTMSVFYGLNGQGKTNLLESIYLLGTGRPFRSARIPDLIRHEQDNTAVVGEIRSGEIDSEISLYLAGNARRVSVDGKAIHRASDLHGRLPTVIFTPDDTAMIKQGPESRRRYLDRTLYGCNRHFLQHYHSYYRILKQRNTLLRSGNRNGLEEWTDQLLDAGLKLILARQEFVKEFNGLFQETYVRISSGLESVSIGYKPDVQPEGFRDLVNQSIDSDLRHGATSHGPHRDDLRFQINGRSLRTFGSQGQQRSYVLALKMTELDYLQSVFGEFPVLLLDDMASELDRKRIGNLLAFLHQRSIQTMITTTDPETLPDELYGSSSRFRVKDGTLTYEETKRR